jgi:hypothetical protein
MKDLKANNLMNPIEINTSKSFPDLVFLKKKKPRRLIWRLKIQAKETLRLSISANYAGIMSRFTFLACFPMYYLSSTFVPLKNGVYR